VDTEGRGYCAPNAEMMSRGQADRPTAEASVANAPFYVVPSFDRMIPMLNHNRGLYLAAIAEGFLDLAVDTFEYLSEGKDSVAWVVNRQLLFRFPKQELAEQKLLMELRLLPALAPTLPLAIPHFTSISRTPTASYPRAFAGYGLLDGTPLHAYTPHIWDATWWQPFIGDFVTALHRFPVRRATQLSVPTYTTRTWHAHYQALYAAVREKVYPLVTPNQRVAIGSYFDAFVDDPRHFTFAPVLVHGDLHARHFLLDIRARRVTGILDFGECRIGDPAIDVRDAWLPYYGGVVDQTWQERCDFYYRLPALAQVALHDNYGAEWVEEGLAEIGRLWPA